MTCYQESFGSIVLPASAKNKVRVAMAKFIMSEEQSIYQAFVKFWDQDKNGSRRYTYDDLNNGMISPSCGFNSITEKMGYIYGEAFWDMLKPLCKGLKPLKKDYIKTKTTRSLFFNDDLSVHFEENVVMWKVEERNRAHNRARMSLVGKAFFSSMASVKWTRESGGVVFYRDEFMKENSHDVTEFSTSIAFSYGPLGDRTKQEWAELNNKKFQALYR